MKRWAEPDCQFRNNSFGKQAIYVEQRVDIKIGHTCLSLLCVLKSQQESFNLKVTLFKKQIARSSLQICLFDVFYVQVCCHDKSLLCHFFWQTFLKSLFPFDIFSVLYWWLLVFLFVVCSFRRLNYLKFNAEILLREAL